MQKRKFKLIGLASLGLAAALCASAAQAFDYSYVEGGFLSHDDGRNDDTGGRVAGSVSIAPPFALIGEYSGAGNYDQFSVGGLFHAPVAQGLDAVGGATVEFFDENHRNDTGYGLRGGVRWQLPQTQLELNPELRLVHVYSHTDVSGRLAALYTVARQVDLVGAVQGGDDDRLELGARYNFGS